MNILLGGWPGVHLPHPKMALLSEFLQSMLSDGLLFRHQKVICKSTNAKATGGRNVAVDSWLERYPVKRPVWLRQDEGGREG